MQRNKNRHCPQSCINPRTVFICAPLSRSGHGLTLPAAAVTIKGLGCCRDEGTQGTADAGV